MIKRVLFAALLCAACSDDAVVRDELPGPETESDETTDELAQLLASGDVADLRPAVELEDTGVLAGDESKLIVGPRDDRVPVADTSIAPYSQTVLLLARFTDGALGLCTGTLIAADAVLTAAHCVDSFKHKGMTTEVLVVPGAYIDKNGRQQALSKTKATWVYPEEIFRPKEFDSSHPYRLGDVQHDYAVLRLSQPLGKSVGTRPLAASSEPQGTAITTIAYHEDKCERRDDMCAKAAAFRQFQSTDTVRKVVDGTWFEHGLDTRGGSSGAAITITSAARAPVYALNVAENEKRQINIGLLLTRDKLATIRAWAGIQ